MSLDPASLPRFSVVRIPYRFTNATNDEIKRFVILGHQAGHVICIKATTKVDVYKNSPEKMAGCVFYKANEVKFFETETAIQPDNPFPIPHAHIIACASASNPQILGNLPSDFCDKLKLAIEISCTLSKERKYNLIELIK